MRLVIQSNIPGRLDVWLSLPKHTVHRSRQIQYHGSEFLLGLIDQLLTDQHTSLKQLKEIIVVLGPGPFTAVRTGIVVANTLGLSTRVPVQGMRSATTLSLTQIRSLPGARIGKKAFEPVHPWYGKQPNITKAG
jgi:tRNA A37 threonylcarbamoyladenosine modification protein TsaB